MRARDRLRPQRQHADRAAAARCAGVGLHSEFLASNGPGAHHLGFLVDDIDAEVAAGAALGFERVQGATFGALRFCYLDTWDAFGLYVELVEDPDAMMMALMPWR